MLDFIRNFYELIFLGFKFILKDEALQISLPENISTKKKISARQFITLNKDSIIQLIKNNDGNIFYLMSKDVRFPLSFSQERLWFIEQYEETTNAYNIPMIFKLSNNTNLEILESSIRSIISRHEILRSLVKENHDGRSYQLVLNDKDHTLEITTTKVQNR